MAVSRADRAPSDATGQLCRSRAASLSATVADRYLRRETARQALPVLLSRALGGQLRDLDLVERPADVAPYPPWALALRCLADGSLSERELAVRARVSSRLAVAVVTGCARRGWVTASGPPGRRTAELTDAGRRTCTFWPPLVTGHDLGLRSVLETLVGQLPYELAHHPASYGSADPSVVGGPFVRGTSDDDLPLHAADWRWVRRDPGAGLDVSDVALLSQLLLALAIDYEAMPMWPLASTTLVVQHLSLTPRPLSELPAGHGISGNGKSLLERHGVAAVTGRAVALTPYGEKIRSHHEPYLAAVETTWRARYGDSLVSDLRAALESLPAAADASLPDHVVLQMP